ncbi:MFS transporter [Natronosporangium hydrolyticum]|uniref:MFS transporter n=1 Tax=Natronosporangium hydrolyticum TaxID=2811111 RepID=A0A895YQP8_9ACTN|nr:MFS transporter [Natronosporangium hydrolyticum]QSB16328.1 MFS transporter [Natronosporangium hydrolyticum]
MDAAPSAADTRRNVRKFQMIWAGQLCSAIGSSLTGFVLGVWVFQSTGSATQFAIIFMASTLPGVIVAPFAGAIVDRYDRRMLMVISNAAGGVVIAVLAALLWTDIIQVWHVYLTAAAAAVFGALHMTAFYAVTPQLVPKEKLGKANGLLQITQAARIAAPLVAGLLLATIGLRGVILIDLAASIFAILVLVLVPLRKELTNAPGADTNRSFLSDLGYGWTYLRSRSGLMALVLLFTGFNFCYAIAGVLVQPLILSFSNEVTLGILMFCGGAGFFAGSVLMSTWGGPKRRVRGILIILAIGGVVLALHGVAPSPWLIAVVAPLFLVTLPLLMGTSMALVQTKVEGEAMGRVIAAVRMAGQAAMPLAYVLAGPLADRVAEPAMADGAPLGDSVGSVIGAGPGRGIALIFWVVGLMLILLAIAGAASSKLRRLEEDLPDADHTAPATPPAAPEPEPEPELESAPEREPEAQRDPRAGTGSR